MTTAADIVERAFRKIGIKAEDEALTADQMTHGLETLNSMIAAWRLEGVDTSLPEMNASDDFQLGREFHEGCIYMLAARLSPDYMVPPSFDPDRWFRTFQAHYLRIDDAKMPMAMRRTSSQRRIRL